MTKDEIKDEMKNRISMALKDSILQQGFEIICRENAELKKENEELKAKNIWYSEQVCNKECAEVWGLLTKAKSIIKDFIIVVKGANITVCGVPEENRCINVLKLNEQAEQFLKNEVSE